MTLNNKTVDPQKIEVQYAIIDGNVVIVNTRTSQALERAGIPRSEWNIKNITDGAGGLGKVLELFERNDLTSESIKTVYHQKERINSARKWKNIN